MRVTVEFTDGVELGRIDNCEQVPSFPHALSGSSLTAVTQAAGWYPDPTNPLAQRWWDGQNWSDHTAPLPPKQASKPVNYLAVVGSVLTLIGAAIAAFTQVSVASGMSTVYVGAALAVGGLVLAWVGKARTGIKVLCVLLAVIAVASAAYDQKQVDDKRRQIDQILNGTP